MRIGRTFEAPITEAFARERIITFFTRAGYRQLPDSGGGLHFKRGSIIGTFSNFNPTKWACSANIGIKSETTSSQISLEYEISTDPTEKDFGEELLTAELSRLEDAVTTNEFNIFDVSDLKKRITSRVFHVVIIFAALILAVIIGIVAGFFASINLNIPTLGSAAIGTGIFLILAAVSLIILRRQKQR
jgi:hypothetical protein